LTHCHNRLKKLKQKTLRESTMKKNILLLILLFIISNLFVCPGPATASESIQEIQFMTENYPPFNYIEDNKIKGIFVEVLMAVSRQMESPLGWDRISVLPRDKGYQSLSAGGKKCLFGTARTKERETVFKWAGPVAHNRIVLIAKAGSDIRINSIDRIRSLKTGVVKDDIAEKILLEADLPPEGLSRAFGGSAAMELLQDLNTGMIDVWAQGDLPARWLIKKTALAPRDFKTLYVLREEQMYFAFSNDVSNGFISVFQRALDRVKKKGDIKRILKTYLSEDMGGF
jgi:polar amino acid transport system substrate-binding protein